MEKVISPDFRGATLGYANRPAFANLYAVAGRFISIESADRDHAELFRHHFANLHVTSVVGKTISKPDATIFVAPTSDPPPAPSHLEAFEVAEGGICRTDATNYFLECNGSAIRANGVSPPFVEVWVGQGTQARERGALSRLIFNASMTAMRRCGLFELQAAGVVRDGLGVLVIGPSGSGKSTLATQLATAGWQYLSDDALLLYNNHEKIEAHAVRRVFSLKEETISAGGMAHIESVAPDPRHFDPLKKAFAPQAVFPDQFVKVCAPTTLFFSQITNEPSSSTRALSRNETMGRLLRMCPWSCYDKPTARTHLSVLAKLARQARGYELLAGTDLFGDAEFAGRYLAPRT